MWIISCGLRYYISPINKKFKSNLFATCCGEKLDWEELYLYIHLLKDTLSFLLHMLYMYSFTIFLRFSFDFLYWDLTTSETQSRNFSWAIADLYKSKVQCSKFKHLEPWFPSNNAWWTQQIPSTHCVNIFHFLPNEHSICNFIYPIIILS